jgi:sarcosine oxidase subunit gamma
MSDRDDFGSTAPGRYGAADTTGVTLSEGGIVAAWNLQGEPGNSALIGCAQQLFGVVLQDAPNTTTQGDGVIALWLGPRSWLLVEGSPSGPPSKLADFSGRRDRLNALGAALFDVSASRVAYRIGGNHAVTVLEKSCPLDFSPDAFPIGGCAQSMLGHINALFYRKDATSFLMLVARSLARDAWRLLCRSSASHGYEVAAAHTIIR